MREEYRLDTGLGIVVVWLGLSRVHGRTDRLRVSMDFFSSDSRKKCFHLQYHAGDDHPLQFEPARFMFWYVMDAIEKTGARTPKRLDVLLPTLEQDIAAGRGYVMIEQDLADFDSRLHDPEEWKTISRAVH